MQGSTSRGLSQCRTQPMQGNAGLNQCRTRPMQNSVNAGLSQSRTQQCRIMQESTDAGLSQSRTQCMIQPVQDSTIAGLGQRRTQPAGLSQCRVMPISAQHMVARCELPRSLTTPFFCQIDLFLSTALKWLQNPLCKQEASTG